MIPVLGGPGLEAAEQLLARAGCLRPEHPWMVGEDTAAAPRIDFAVLADRACLLDLSEEAVARIAVSLATGRPVDLRSAFGHLTRDHAQLVMIALAVAGGHDRVGSRIRVVGDERRVETAPPLAVWPS
ncbi:MULTISPECIES: hypothetical protein [unclassified Rathayibacter]|uniref:hypothetical protein n=1 Tax=unclassified Rathayibacter TaxID=2609250 RepID=UPI000CE86B27|nr:MULTISPECIES: hypothetical protein [unclassified Rathayibacter]PPG52308.1 hypothetical protein C5C24_04910 [Rathayibacter sp. AY2B3]PPI22800.1 hypothetical protein C5D44_13875 [Rathayibacter sp. AY1B5]PPI25665.1 hypothetical protein C5D08_00865 [Rathayibacter sp. AY1B6]PPI32398.1 hypothetical protein C5D34_11465 [Rathayibacter sp. AY1B1]